MPDIRMPHTNDIATQNLQRELSYLKLPAANWSIPHHDPDGNAMPEVAIIGAGMFGIAAAVSLILKGIHNIRLFDNSIKGRAGPWMTYARMPTLRSSKELPGLALGMKALTFRAWYEAVYGEEAFASVYKISNAIWQDYLNWIAQAFALPIEYNTSIRNFSVEADHVVLEKADGSKAYAGRLIIASGRAGAGGANIPGFIDRSLFPERAAHSSDAIDFSALSGKHVAVIGAGASALDNAATALEHGAAGVTMYARRKALPQINKGRAYAFPGFFEGWYGLTPEQKWQTAVYLDDVQPPPPHETVHRTLAAGDRFQMRFGTQLQSVGHAEKGIALTHADGSTDHADFLIVGTGFRVDLTEDPLFAKVADKVALWRDRYQPHPEFNRPRLGYYPWLGDGFELEEREATDGQSALNRVHLFNHAASVSFGALASDIPGITTAAERLSSRVLQQVFREDFASHQQNLIDWEAEWELLSTPFYAR